MTAFFVPNGNASHFLSPAEQTELADRIAKNQKPGRIGGKRCELALGSPDDDLPTVYVQAQGHEFAIGFVTDNVRPHAGKFPGVVAPVESPDVVEERRFQSAVSRAVQEALAALGHAPTQAPAPGTPPNQKPATEPQAPHTDPLW